MVWAVTIIILVIAVILAILFLNRFYKKATREVALVRTGAGGQKVVLDGGCLALPILHKVSEVNMRTTKLEIDRRGERSMITSDRLRVDAGVEFYVRVQPTPEGVATAAQALGGKSFRAAELAEILEGKLVDAMLAVAARYTMETLQDNRGKYVAEITEMLQDNLGLNGLLLESVSLTQLDQTPFASLDENNAFNAVGMRRLAEIIATNKKERAAIEADADVSVRQTQLNATKQRLVIEQQEEEAVIVQQRDIETSRAVSQAEIAENQSQAEQRRENARITREREVRAKEIERDRALRKIELDASLATDTAKHDREIELAAKRIEESKAQAKAQAARADEISAQEAVETTRARVIAEREKELALIRAAEQVEVDDARVKSETGTMVSMAEASAKSVSIKAQATKDEMLAKAEGKAAMVAADNAQSPEVISMKIDMARLETLPHVVGQMVKPAEKIDSIRINHISGFGGTGGSGNGSQGSDKAVVNQVVDGVLSMALQMPAVQQLGEQIGINIADGIKGLGKGAEGPQAKSDAPGKTPDDGAKSESKD